MEKVMKALSLLELNALVGEVIDQTLSRCYWVEAELSEVRERGGATRQWHRRRPAAGATAGE